MLYSSMYINPGMLTSLNVKQSFTPTTDGLRWLVTQLVGSLKDLTVVYITLCIYMLHERYIKL